MRKGIMLKSVIINGAIKLLDRMNGLLGWTLIDGLLGQCPDGRCWAGCSVGVLLDAMK